MNAQGRPVDWSSMTRTALLVAVLSTSAAVAEETSINPAHSAPGLTRRPSESPFDRRFGLAGYALGGAGTYTSGGIGGRIRFEAFRWLGLDLFGEAMLVAVPRGLRHDHPIGFNLFVPFRFGERVRLRPTLGMCVTPSFLHSENPDAKSADTILVGVHAGGGVEVALHDRLSFFAEAKAVAWWGNDRSVEGWTTATTDLRWSVIGQANLGFTVHLGGT